MAARHPAKHTPKLGSYALATWGLPVLGFLVTLVIWDRLCVWNEIPTYILPRPHLVWAALINDWQLLARSLINTLVITFFGLLLAIFGGICLSLIFMLSRPLETTLYPFAIILQVTPLVAIFPLINIYVDAHTAKLLLCAFIVAFFPILSNTLFGLKSADHNLRDLFCLYRASRWQTLFRLQLPSALPSFLAGVRISGGLALIGAVVAEFITGSAGQNSGLAARIIEAGHKLNTPRLFAILTLIALSGITVFLSVSYLCHLLLHKWHESAIKRKV